MLAACGGATATPAPQPTAAGPTSAAAPTTAAACSSDASDGEEVVIAGFEYQPDELTVPAGTTVAWTNTDAEPHTVTFDGGPDCGSLAQNESAALEFTTAGAFDYVCTFHPNMQATIIVE
jgi:plastocyanin